MIMKTDDQPGYSCHLRVRITWASESSLTRADAVERVTRIELAWPAWKIAITAPTGVHRVARLRS
jgi:hypothetical protein